MNNGLIKKYIQLLFQYGHFRFLILSIFTEIVRGFILTQGISWGVYWITEATVNQNLQLLIKGIILFSLSICLSVMIVYISELLLNKKLILIHSEIRTTIIDNTLFGEQQDVRNIGIDEINYVYNHNIQNFTNFYCSIIRFFGGFGKIIGGYIAGFFLSWELTLLIMCLGFIKILVNTKLLSKLSRIVEKIQNISTNIFSYLIRCIEGIFYFRMVADKKKIQQLFDDKLYEGKNYRNEIKELNIKIATINQILESISFLLLLAAATCLCAMNVITIGVFTSFISMYDNFVNPYSFINGFISQYHSNIIGIKKIIDIIDIPNIHLNDTATNSNAFTIKLDNVCFSYTSTKQIFNKFNHIFYSGKRTYILGRSGVGKSTLLKLIAGIYQPQQGEILLCNDRGEENSINSLQIAYVSQEPFLFNGTIAENITMCEDSQIDHERLKNAIKKSGIKEMVESLPERENTIIHNNGSNFSGGQKCCLALARLFYNPKSIILLDEPYASLDNKTIETIEQAMCEIKNNSCVLFITHRKEWIPSDATILHLD